MEKAETGSENPAFESEIQNGPGPTMSIKNAASERKPNQKPKTEPRMKFKRTIIIEPTFALMYMFHVSSYALCSMFIYHAIGEREFNLTAAITAAGGLNESGPCDNQDQNNSLYMLQQEVQARTAKFMLFLDLTGGIPAIFSILFYGTVVDRIGRKPVLIISMLGLTTRSIIYLLVQIPLPLELLFLAHLLEALSGGISAYMTACYAFYADTVSPENLGRRLAISDVAYGFTLAGMDVLMGIAIQKTGYMWPFVLVISGNIVNLFYTIFFVPETIDKEANRKPLSPTFMIDSFKVLSKKRPNRGQFLLVFYLITWWVCSYGIFMRYSLERLYKLNSPFCWDAFTIGLFDGLQSFISNFVQVLMGVFVIKRIGEIFTVQISCGSFVAAFVIMALSYTDWMMLLVPLVGCFMGLQLPVMKAILSSLVPNEEQGAIFSVTGAIDHILMLVGVSFYNSIYAATLLTFKGTVFLIMAGFVLIAMILLWIFSRLREKERKKANDSDTLSVHSVELYMTKF